MTYCESAPIARTLPAPTAYLCGLTWDGSRLWHSDQDAQTIFAIDPSDGTVTRSWACARVRADLAYDGTRLLQVGGHPKRLVLIDPATGESVGEKTVLPRNGRLTGIEFGPEGLWMCLRAPTVVQLRNYATMEIERQYPAGGESPSGLTYADGLVLHGDYSDSTVRALNARTGAQVGAVRVPGRPTGMTWDGSHLWYCDFPARALRAIELDAVLVNRA
ncbi:PQQ-binding-like beta-propeller repeat protein [Nocardia colli]|uniref:PQQ-binding-like beta-propeller repeat protein n=1 Tax=Nocardia colli TaxID=2545717 RepID=A0A5N0E2X3_9NOCA|nr:PQQ-binding-like beta-propeller repeat protein [Nocardia colli]KAA8883768.1 PQQ-binding-like beta-propeller repeat protein [Nocardia colli]